jgi:hypothetical protein
MERSAIRESRFAAPDFAEPVIGRRFAPTRWLHPGYELTTTVLALNAAEYWIIRFRG